MGKTFFKENALNLGGGILILSLIYVLFLNTSYAENKDVFFDLLSESHLLESQFKREAAISLSLKLAAENIEWDSKEVIVFETHKKDMDALIFELYKKQFAKEFTKDEIEYLRKLYSHHLSKKLTAFNSKFLKTADVKLIIQDKAELIKKQILKSPKHVRKPQK